MQDVFYTKVEKLKEKIFKCQNIKQIREAVRESDLELNISYTSWKIFNIEENLNSGDLSGHFRMNVVANLSDGERTTTNGFNHRSEWLCEEAVLTKEEMEKRRTIAIIDSLKHLDTEEYNG